MTLGQKKVDSPAPRRLESWKHIASYLNCNERTAKRWEATRQLPIRRLPGARGGVFALVHEIEAWQMSALDPSVRHAPPLQENISSDEAAATVAPAPLEALCLPTIDPIPVEDEALPTLAVPVPAGVYAGEGFRWQLVAGVALLLLLIASLSRLHQSALASRREVAAHVPSAAARELDLRGRFYWNKRTPQDLKFALNTFQQAVAMDPEYADAYAGMAECYGLSTEYAFLSTAKAYPLMLAAAQKAVELDPNLATAHRAMGFAMFYWNWDRAGSMREFERSLALNPNDATTHHWYANVLLTSQRFPEALQEIEKARELDPGAPSILADRGLALSYAGRTTEAREDWLQLEKTDPAYLPPHWYLARHYLDVNDVTNYAGELQTIASITGSTEDTARAKLAQAAFARGRQTKVVNDLADFSVQLYDQHRTSAMKVAFALTSAGRNQEALEYIRRGYEDRDQDFLVLPDRNRFPALLDSTEFQSLVAKSRLPYPQTHQFAAASIPALRD